MWKYALAAVAVLGVGLALMGGEAPPPGDPGDTQLADEGIFDVRGEEFPYRVWDTPDGFLGELQIDIGWIPADPQQTLDAAVMALRVMAAEHAKPSGRVTRDPDLGLPEEELVIVPADIAIYTRPAKFEFQKFPATLERYLANDICAGTKSGVTRFAHLGLGGLNFGDVDRHGSWLPFYDLCIGYIEPGTYVGIPAGFYVAIWRTGDEDKLVVGPFDSWVEIPGGRPEADVERGIRWMLTTDYDEVAELSRE